jgi:hypothetical protein
VQSCFVSQWTRFALRRLETDDDRASLDAITNAFAKDGNNVRDLLVGVVGARSFRYRSPLAGETLQ